MSDSRRSSQPSLFDEPAALPPAEPSAAVVPPSPDVARDQAARDFAVDPANNVVLEASAGTGKTSVLVARYLNLLRAGVEPGNILAITFTRKAAAEMRERIIHDLRDGAARSELDRRQWAALRDRLGEIAISTIDAFCLSLLREFPLEADLDPGFDLADETEVPRLIDDALDRSVRIFGGIAKHDADVAMVIAQLGMTRAREGLAALLGRRLVAEDALDRFLVSGSSDLTGEVVCRRAATALQDALRTVPGGLTAFLADGPVEHPRFQLLRRELGRLQDFAGARDAQLRTLMDRVAAHFLTGEGRPRSATGQLHPYKTTHYPSTDASKRHRQAVAQIAPQIERVVFSFARDLNVVLARGVRRMFAIAAEQYRRALEERSVIDFADVLQRAVELLRRMDEFSQSRFRLESRYHHVLVDEFQDTSRAQWELVSLLVQSWKEGLGIATRPSIFVVGDRKQSIYRFRDAEVALLSEAGHHIDALRPGGGARRTISRSFRAVPELLAFVNDACGEMAASSAGPDDFTFADGDRFPVLTATDERRGPVLGLAVANDPDQCAEAVAAEVTRILREDSVRDRATGVPRAARPGDIALLFRSRTSHREFEQALERRGVPTYVYKGLGFFDADEIKDLTSLIRYLASPESDIRAGAFLRSRVVRLSDQGLAVLAPGFGRALMDADPPASIDGLDEEDRRVLTHLRAHVHDWIARVDRVPPADLIEQLLPSIAYAHELKGPRRGQAWENVKKLRGLVRRIQNRGYATLRRIADHLDALTPGDESNAILEALDAVNLMTVHASKGLEFPIVFVVNLARGASGPPLPIRVVGGAGEPSVSVGPFVSEIDEAERAREKHETRRLLYVAFTRARDRLYLSSPLKDGQLHPNRGSLADVLPESLKPLFARAATVFDECETVAWEGPSGRSFDWRLCRPPAALDSLLPEAADAAPPGERRDLFEPIDDDSGAVWMSVTDWLRTAGDEPDVLAGARSRDALTGTLVHRLFQHAERLTGTTADQQAAAAASLLRPEERAGDDGLEALVSSALAIWRRMRARPEVVRLLDRGRTLHEVPFSCRVGPETAPVIVRGTIDCLVEHRDGLVTVVEFKTGSPRGWHQAQLDLYVSAARALYPDSLVDGTLVYAD